MQLNMSMQRWTKLKVTGVKPSGRIYHAACGIVGSQHPVLTVVGGNDNKGKTQSDVWLLDVDEGVWNKVSSWEEGERREERDTVSECVVYRQ